MEDIDFQQARQTIARLIEVHMGVPTDKVMADTPFLELHKDFDSLTMLELQLLLEKEYDMEFDNDAHSRQDKLPANVTELAQVLTVQHAAYRLKQARTLAIKQAKSNAAVKSPAPGNF